MPVNSFKRKHFVGEIIFQTVRWYLKYALSGSVAKDLALLQNQCKPSQLGKLINLIAGKWHKKVIIIVSKYGNVVFVPQP